MNQASDPDIVFDDQGICNYCYAAQKKQNQQRIDRENLPWIIDGLRGKKCLIGLSGGVDSAYALYILKQHNIDVTAYHFDNGYNTQVADANVMKLVEGMKVPLFRYKIDRDKFNELYQSFIKGGIKNLEAVTDHILFAIAYEMANKEGVKTVISGGNWQGESIMPKHFGEDPRDLYWIKSVYRRVTGSRLRGLPVIPLWKEQYNRLIKGIKFIPILDHVDYNREKAIALLHDKYGYENPGGKHEESTLTKWFQNVYLYGKYELDKRVPHYSSLIHSGQMTRQEAVAKLKVRPEQVDDPFKVDWMAKPKTYDDYPNSEWIRKQVIKAYGNLRRS